MKKRMLALALALLLTLSGCASKTETTELEEFDIILDWYPNAVHAFIYQAIAQGYYEEEGLKVNIQFPANSNDAISLTAAGQADAGIYYMHQVIEANIVQEVPIRSIATFVQSPLCVFLSVAGIDNPADLEGKRLGTSEGDLSQSIVQTTIAAAGANENDIEMIDVGFDLMSSMVTGNVDATYGCFVNHELPMLEKEGFTVDYFSPTEYGMPNYYELVLVTGQTQIDENSEKLEKFLRASARGFEDMKNDPEAVLEVLINNQNEENYPLDPDVEAQSLEILLPMMETEELEFLGQDVTVWQETMDWMYEKGMIDSLMDASEIVVNLDY